MHDHAYWPRNQPSTPQYARSCRSRRGASRDRLECTIVHPEGLSGSIAQEVRRFRREQGLRQDELALAAGVSVRAVHQIEAGKPTTRLDVLERVLSALGLRVDLTPRHRRSASGE